MNSYFVFTYFFGMKVYSVKARNRKEAAEKGVENIINEKYKGGRNFDDYFPILAAVKENPEALAPLTLYVTKIQGREEEIKEVKDLKEIEVFLRSGFRGVRDKIKDIEEFKRVIEALINRMKEELY
ncbi:hypothetical protein J7K44_00130 [bacterium]|nr:hypothetical protein [bacterium]